MKNNIVFLLVWFVGATTFGAPAHAYLDPGTGSIVLQLLLGGLAGAMVVLKLYWAQLKAFLSRKQKLPVDDEKIGGR